MSLVSVQEAQLQIPPLRDPVMGTEILPSVSLDLKERLGPLGERLQQQVTEAMSRRGARLQEIRVQADGIEISLESGGTVRKP